MPTEDPLPDPLYFTGPDDAPEEREAKPGFVPELVKRMAVAGLGAIFMTEEGIRNLAGQLKLPKEVLAFILSQAEKTKDELARIVSEELRRFLQSEKLREEFVKLLAGMTMEINAQVRLVPSEGKAGEHHPKVTVSELSTRVKKRQKKE
ncbi:MAG TPA: hypothetical protein VKE49_07560 [Myxococcaceae bacterium]|nr:hypothetical protein [Myxococcaceae bacterium]